MGHRRELTAAATFDAAATFGLWAALGDATGAIPSHAANRLDAASIHLYLVSAVFTICGRRSTPQEQSSTISVLNQLSLYEPLGFLKNAEALENLGDALFGIASIIDVTLGDLSFDDASMLRPIFVATLWLLDSLLYLRADFVTLCYTSLREDNRLAAGVLEGFDAVVVNEDGCLVHPSSPKMALHVEQQQQHAASQPQAFMGGNAPEMTGKKGERAKFV